MLRTVAKPLEALQHYGSGPDLHDETMSSIKA